MVLSHGSLQQFSISQLKQPSHFATFPSLEACYEQFWYTLNLAVKDRLRTEQPVATHLTGGLDSTTVTLSILERLPEVHAFTNTTTVFPEFDERKPIQAFLKRYPQVKWHGVNGDRAWALQEPWERLPLPDDPLIACTIPMHLQLMEKMKSLGCQVVFEGDWGDELFNVGLRDLGGKSLISALTESLKSCANNSQRKYFLYRYLLLPNLPQFLRSKYLMTGVSIVPWLQTDYIESPIFQRSLQQKFYSQLPRRAIQTIADYATQTVSVGYRQTYRLLAKFHGLQMTAPFQDRRIVEFSLALKPEMKLSNEYYKIFLRQINRKKLPDTILWRPKENYFNPLIYAGIAKGEKPIELLDYLDSSEELQAYFDKDKLSNTLHQYRQEFADGYQPNTRYKPQQTAQLFASFTFINWHKKLSQEML
jgi:asparagine synthase (glutamine-hydrolysing)